MINIQQSKSRQQGKRREKRACRHFLFEAVGGSPPSGLGQQRCDWPARDHDIDANTFSRGYKQCLIRPSAGSPVIMQSLPCRRALGRYGVISLEYRVHTEYYKSSLVRER